MTPTTSQCPSPAWLQCVTPQRDDLSSKSLSSVITKTIRPKREEARVQPQSAKSFRPKIWWAKTLNPYGMQHYSGRNNSNQLTGAAITSPCQKLWPRMSLEQPVEIGGIQRTIFLKAHPINNQERCRRSKVSIINALLQSTTPLRLNLSSNLSRNLSMKNMGVPASRRLKRAHNRKSQSKKTTSLSGSRGSRRS